MSSASDYLETLVLDHLTGNGVYTYPGSMFVALFTSASSAAELEQGILTNEVSGINYQRRSIVFDVATQNQTLNINDVIFDQAGAGGWGNIAYCALVDSFTAGNILFHGSIGTPVDITDGDVFKFNISNVSLTIT